VWCSMWSGFHGARRCSASGVGSTGPRSSSRVHAARGQRRRTSRPSRAAWELLYITYAEIFFFRKSGGLTFRFLLAPFSALALYIKKETDRQAARCGPHFDKRDEDDPNGYKFPRPLHIHAWALAVHAQWLRCWHANLLP
jgi:hypothetical protein